MEARLTEWEEMQYYMSKGFTFFMDNIAIDVSFCNVIQPRSVQIYSGTDLSAAFASCELYLQT